MQKRATCVGRRSKCLRFQPSKSSSSYPLDAYYRTHRERQTFKTNAFSFTCCSQQGESSFLFWGPSSFFRCWCLSVHPLPFPPQEKKNCREREKQRDVAELKREIFSFLVETTRHTYKSRITSQQKIQTSWCIQ